MQFFSFSRPLKVACENKHWLIVDYLLSNLSFKCESIQGKLVGPSSSLSLWYVNPASEWIEFLPIGNGHMGAMISGGYPRETIQLNSDTLWAGCPHDYAREGAVNSLGEIRQLILDEKWIDAQKMLNENFFGNPINQAPYQTVGNVFIDFLEDCSSISLNDYQRELNLEEAITRTTYSTSNGIDYQRSCFASYPDKSIIYSIQSAVRHLFRSIICLNKKRF